LSEYLQTTFDKFELRVRKGYYYTEDGLWASLEGARVRIGVSDYLQRIGGDVAFIEPAKHGSIIERQKEIGVLETVKAAFSLPSPISGQVEEINPMILEKPELINSDPYGEGWLVILKPINLETDLKTLMRSEDYFQLMLKKLETEHGKLGSR
jgi:glycine cleavage system H protein